MTEIAFLFPGQGSQRVGMGRDLAADYPDLMRRYYRTADELLGIPLSRLCFEGPAEDLRRTDITQPAIFLTSLVTLDVLQARGFHPRIVAGHSLGEYTALVAAGVLDWTDALRLVRRRGELMAAVNEQSTGAMVAIIGLDLPAVDALCRTVRAQTGRVVEIANDNEPNQVVVSGLASPVAMVAAAAKTAGAERAVQLDVGAPFHCSLMREVELEFAAALAEVTFHDPRVPVIANATAQRVRTGADAAELLRRQLVSTVRWTETLQALAAGTDRFVEVGPGRVLTGFCRATCPDIPVHATSDGKRLRQTMGLLAAAGDVREADGVAA